jgi:hypothetical protein
VTAEVPAPPLFFSLMAIISGRLEDATGHQNEVAKDSYVRSVWLDTGDMRKPHYDCQHNQSY